MDRSFVGTPHRFLVYYSLINLRSLNNKVIKKLLPERHQDCSILWFTESWLSLDILSLSIQPAGFSIKKSRGKKKGIGLWFMINYSWCDCGNVQELKSFCSPGLRRINLQSNADCITYRENSLWLSSQPCIFPLKLIGRRLSKKIANLTSWDRIYCSWGLQ